MFIGHYSVALALKKVERTASLGWLFIAVQFVDILFFPLVLLGIERLRIVENFTESTHFALDFMPYTHGLAASLLWAAAAFAVWRALPSKSKAGKHRHATVIAFAVFSHWILDLVVHTPDLPLLGNGSVKLGFGLWNSALLTFTLEAALLFVGMILYLRNTRPTSKVGKYGILAFSLLLIAVNAFNIYGPAPTSIEMLATMSLGSYLGFAAIAFWLDRQRVPRLGSPSA